MLDSDHPTLFEILLVEENPEELERAGTALTEANIPINLRVTKGAQTLALLRREGEFHDASRPDLILLDLPLPMKSGIDLLAAIKEDQNLKNIPVAVLGPFSEEAIDESFEHAADVYIAKPLDPQRLIMTVNWAQGQ
jgi:two-component system, chemotaxis family, response regulator Rcp1